MNFDSNFGLHVASCAWFLYDYVLSFADEVEFVWARGVSWNAAGYVAAKLAAIAGLVADTLAQIDRSYDIPDCGRLFLVLGVSSVFITAYTDLMLILRLYYMYDCNRRLLWSAIAAFVGLYVAHAIINGRRATSSISISPDGGACVYRAPLWKAPVMLWLAYHVHQETVFLLRATVAFHGANGAP